MVFPRRPYAVELPNQEQGKEEHCACATDQQIFLHAIGSGHHVVHHEDALFPESSPIHRARLVRRRCEIDDGVVRQIEFLDIPKPGIGQEAGDLCVLLEISATGV